MIIKRINLEGIGPYRTPIDLNLDELDGMIAIVGESGSGKTYLAEAILFALYGEGCWYKSSPYDLLTQGGCGVGRVLCEFEYGGEAYEIERLIKSSSTGKTMEHKAWLRSCGEGIAGPKVRDVRHAVELRFGTLETARATWFLSQNRMGDACGQPGEEDLTARRRAMFDEILQLAELDTHQDRTSNALTFLKGQAVSLRGWLQNTDTPDEDELDTIRGRIGDGETFLKCAQAKLKILKAEFDEKSRERMEYEANRADELLQIKQLKQAENALNAVRARIKRLEEDLRVSEERAKMKGLGKQEVEDLAAAEAEEKTLLKQQADHDRYKEWWSDRDRLTRTIASLHDKIDSLNAVKSVPPSVVLSANSYKAVERELENATGENHEITILNRKRAEERTLLTKEIDQATALLKDRELRKTSLPAPPFGEKCNPCPYVKDSLSLGDEIEGLAKRIKSLRQQLDAIPPDQPLNNINQLEADLVVCTRAVESVKADTERQHQIDAAMEQLETAEHNYDHHLTKAPEDVEDPTGRLAHVREEIRQLSGAHERLAAAERAIKQVDELSDLLKLADEDHRGAVESHNTAQRLAKSAMDNAEERERTLEEMGNDLANLDADIKSAEKNIEKTQGFLSQARIDIQTSEERLKEVAYVAKQIDDIEDTLGLVKTLNTIFGPKGARQLLVDASAPELERVSDDLFQRATEGRMRLRIETQRMSSTGEMIEDLRILVRDARGEREAWRYSGGQLQLILILFRLAVMLWLSEKASRSNTLILDEAFDRLGPDGVQDLMRVLRSLSNRFQQVIVVTHSMVIASAFNSTILVDNTPMGAKITVKENGNELAD